MLVYSGEWQVCKLPCEKGIVTKTCRASPPLLLQGAHDCTRVLVAIHSAQNWLLSQLLCIVACMTVADGGLILGPTAWTTAPWI